MNKYMKKIRMTRIIIFRMIMIIVIIIITIKIAKIMIKKAMKTIMILIVRRVTRNIRTIIRIIKKK